MKNKILIILIFVIINYIQTAYSEENFNFNVTEIEILDDGNLFLGKKRGKATTSDGVILTADTFEYNKIPIS